LLRERSVAHSMLDHTTGNSMPWNPTGAPATVFCAASASPNMAPTGDSGLHELTTQ
jgi:hypothetical protein